MKFTRVFFVFALVASACAATVRDILSDLDKISNAVRSFDDTITKFPATGGMIFQLLRGSVSMRRYIDQTTGHAKNTAPFSQRDAAAVLASIEAIEPSFLHALNTLTRKKGALLAVGIEGIVVGVRTDLALLLESTGALQTALIALAPNSIKGDGGPVLNLNSCSVVVSPRPGIPSLKIQEGQNFRK
ncbi:hypothetical protein LshimejAT787_2300800 [Lyophyllum shimeji]|uniref:Uncharacterized protein n=1 Tax=Lyophyllum shimeji TaxID=47721 RepID=A0A9P3UV59_LYOSH|nr:hypothetical protein LshimejAT787_2300800 [Lyophyllum shimeji]